MSYRVWRSTSTAIPSVIGATSSSMARHSRSSASRRPASSAPRSGPIRPTSGCRSPPSRPTHGRNALLDPTTNHWLYVFGRAKPGRRSPASRPSSNVELQQWLLANESAGQRRRSAQGYRKQHITLVPGGAGLAQMSDNYQHDLRLLIGITALVLLIACANLANLQLARGAANAAQTSIRVALGAPRSRLIRQVLVESTMLAVAGGALGLLVATETAGLLLRLAFHGATYVPIDTAPSLPVLGFAFLLSVVTGVVFGIAPAWSASRADPAAALHGAGRAASGRSHVRRRRWSCCRRRSRSCCWPARD